MESVVLVVGGLFAIFGGLFLISAERVARMPVEAEQGMTPVYAEQAGARFGTWNWTWPFVRVATFKDFVTISCISHHVVLRRGDVRTVERKRHLFSTGLEIHHERRDLPSTLIIWPCDLDRLHAALRASL